jgi:hypothetical protein
VGQHQGLKHDFFRHFGGAGLDHHNRFFRTGDDQIQSRLTHFIVCWIDDVTTFDQADAHAGDGVHERYVRKIKRTRRSGDCNHVRIVVGVC